MTNVGLWISCMWILLHCIVHNPIQLEYLSESICIQILEFTLVLKSLRAYQIR